MVVIWLGTGAGGAVANGSNAGTTGTGGGANIAADCWFCANGSKAGVVCTGAECETCVENGSKAGAATGAEATGA